MKLVVVASSPRKNGNSNALAEAFARGATENGNDVEIIYLYNKHIGFCHGCLACQKILKCVINDDAKEIYEKIGNADVVVFATPIYYYSVSGQLKTMMDRANPLYNADYHFRSVYLLATAADDESSAVDGARHVIQGWVDCFEKAVFNGYVFAGGVTDVGEIKGHAALNEAYELGKNL